MNKHEGQNKAEIMPASRAVLKSSDNEAVITVVQEYISLKKAIDSDPSSGFRMPSQEDAGVREEKALEIRKLLKDAGIELRLSEDATADDAVAEFVEEMSLRLYRSAN